VRSANVDVRIANVDVRIANVDVHIANVDVRIANVNVRIANVDVRIANVDVRIVRVWRPNFNYHFLKRAFLSDFLNINWNFHVILYDKIFIKKFNLFIFIKFRHLEAQCL